MRTFLAITKALSDETRLRAFTLLQEGELCLCQLIGVLGLSPSTVSKHMTILQQAGLLECRKEGRWHYYRLAGRGAPVQVRLAIAWVMKSLGQETQVGKDRRRLKQVQNKTMEEISRCYRK